MSLEELIRRMRSRADTAAALASESAAAAQDPGSPSAFGRSFWAAVFRELELVAALLESSSPEDARVMAERALLVLSLKENLARRAPGRVPDAETERAALQVVLHEVRMDIHAWLGAAV
jgi:hypothetical protein